MSAVQPCIVSVEDDPDLYELIYLTLGPLPVHLHHAKTGLEAIDMICGLEVDLIILDIMLPDINGWNVLKQVFSENNREVKGIVVLTAQTGATHRVIARLQEVTAYMTKPFKPSELRKLVIEILDLDV